MAKETELPRLKIHNVRMSITQQAILLKHLHAILLKHLHAILLKHLNAMFINILKQGAATTERFPSKEFGTSVSCTSNV